MRKIGRSSADRRKSRSRASAGVRVVVLLLGMLLAVTGIVGGLTAAPQKAYACSCAFDPNGNEYIEFADLIFSGTVVERQTTLPEFIGGQSSGDLVDYTFEVDQVWKGKGYEREVVSTAAGTESCGADFRETNRYIVLAKRDGAKLTTSLCSNNTLYAVGTQPDVLQKLQILGEPTEPLPGRSSSTWIRSYLWIVLAAAAALVWAVTWLGLRRCRARRRPRA